MSNVAKTDEYTFIEFNNFIFQINYNDRENIILINVLLIIVLT